MLKTVLGSFLTLKNDPVHISTLNFDPRVSMIARGSFQRGQILMLHRHLSIWSLVSIFL